MTWENFWDWLDRGLLLITMCVSIYNICVSRKNNDDISVILTCEGEEDIQLVQTIKRKHLTRSELQGVLRNATMKSSYDIPYLYSSNFSDSMSKVQDARAEKTIVIKIDSVDEYNGFLERQK